MTQENDQPALNRGISGHYPTTIRSLSPHPRYIHQPNLSVPGKANAGSNSFCECSAGRSRDTGGGQRGGGLGDGDGDGDGEHRQRGSEREHFGSEQHTACAKERRESAVSIEQFTPSLKHQRACVMAEGKRASERASTAAQHSRGHAGMRQQTVVAVKRLPLARSINMVKEIKS